MDMNKIIQMVINQLLRRVVSGGVNAAMRQMSRLSTPSKLRQDEQSPAATDAGKRARQLARQMRKL